MRYWGASTDASTGAASDTGGNATIASDPVGHCTVILPSQRQLGG